MTLFARERGKYRSEAFCVSSENILHLTFCGLAKVAIFTTNVDAENQTLINHKCVCGALNRHFCQTAVLVAQLKYTNKLV